MNRFLVVLALVCLALSGCAATVKRPASVSERLAIPTSATGTIYMLVQSGAGHGQSEDWELFRAEWRTAMAASTGGAGKRFVYLDAMPDRFQEQGVLVVVDVNDYRYLSAGARYGLGVMTGNAYVDAKARFFVLPDQTPAGTRDYATSSTAWQGVFSAMTSKQVAAITDQMLVDIEGR